jgi:hypothetical protein
MAKLVLDDITSGYASVTTINSNSDLIEAAVENTLSRNGATPNSMAADIDMDSNKVLNLATPTSGADAANKAYVDAVAASANDGDTLAVLLADTDEVTNSDALIGVLSPETDAVATTQHARNHLSVLVADFLSEAQIQQSKTDAVSFDASAAIQAAIDTGKDVDFRGLRWLKANNLTQTDDFQNLVCSDGLCRITKNANGDLYTSSGDDVLVDGIHFRGESSTPVYTGNNAVFTGARAHWHRGSSPFAYALALKATGTAFSLTSPTGIFETADITGNQYDIQLGVSGTATLYHYLENPYSSTTTGGIHLIDTGSHTIEGGQIGKLFIEEGTGPAGVGGGKTVGTRILGDVTIDLPNSVFTGCQFGAVDITLTANTSGCSLDASNSYQSGHTVTNDGNANNLIVRQVSTSGCIVTLTPDAAGDVEFPGRVIIPNNDSYALRQASGAISARVSMSSGDNMGVINDVSNKAIQIQQAGATGLIQALVNAVEKLRVSASGVFLGGTTAFDSQGAGTPEGAVTAPVGSTFRRTDGGAATSFYVKESGSGNTGWVGK